MFQSEDLDAIESVVAALRDAPHLTEVELRNGNKALLVRRSPRPAAVKPATAPTGRPQRGPAREAAPERTSTSVAVTAQLVGIFRAAGPADLAEGDMVQEKQVVGQIEAMRLLNDCVAPVAGRLVQVAVQDGQPVQYGQTLFEIQPEPIREVAS